MCANEENRDANAQSAAHKYTRNESQDDRHHFFSDGNFFSTARLTFDFSPSVPNCATRASAFLAWLMSGIG
jgi:hypothetical protein